jgi:hypothetical protein
LLLLMALGFASPFVNRTANTVRKKRLTVIALDRSFSMRADNRMAQARRQAHAVVSSLPGRDLAQVIAFDNRVQGLTTPDYAHPVLDAAIDSVEASDLDSSLGELARGLRTLAQSRDMTLDVHLFSDMQQTSMPQDFHDLDLRGSATLVLHRIGKAAPNWTVEAVSTPPNVYDPKRTHLRATVTGFSTPASDQRVELLLDGKLLDNTKTRVPPDGRAEVEFRGFNVPYGLHRGEVRISAGDQLTPDDRFYFSVERSDPRRVLFLYASGRDHQEFYYRSALESSSDTGLVMESAPLGQVQNKDLSRYAFVVLHDVGALDKAIEQKLCGYVMGGGSALVAIGPETIRAGRIPLSKIVLSESKETQGAGFVEAQHAALNAAGRFENVQFFVTGQWKPGEHDRVLARLADNSPLLVEEPMGEGRVLQFAAALDTSSSDFPLHASYLPFVAQTGRFLAGSEDTSATYVTGSAITLRRARTSKTAAEVTGPDGKRELSLDASKGSQSFTVDREGFYEVTRADGRRQLVAAHADRKESDLRTIPDETLELWRNTGDSAALQQTAESGGAETKPWSFWRYLLVLAGIAGVVEAAIARRHLEEAERTA